MTTTLKATQTRYTAETSFGFTVEGAPDTELPTEGVLTVASPVALDFTIFDDLRQEHEISIIVHVYAENEDGYFISDPMCVTIRQDTTPEEIRKILPEWVSAIIDRVLQDITGKSA